MFEDKTKPYTVPKHPHRVDIDNAEEVRYWMERFRCSRGQLVMVVAKVGFSASDVEQELKQRC
jgi:hypothetical protein